MLLILFFLLLVISGCNSNEREREKRIDRLEIMQKKVSSQFLYGAFVYVFFVLIGPTIAEKSRAAITNKFHLTITSQVRLAKFAYSTLISVILLLSMCDKYLNEIFPVVLLLTGATLYPFLVDVIPSLKNQNTIQRKSGISQIKSFLILIFVFYIILRMLNPEGIGVIQLK